jgi:hypothetical protein
MKKKLFLFSLVLALAGCKTNYYKPGASQLEFQRDMMAAEGYAASQMQNATLMPAQSGLEVLARGIATPAIKRKMINQYMERLGWEKQREK